MEKKSRRDFIKISAVGAGALAVTPTLANIMPGFGGGTADIPNESKVKRHATYCEVCFWKCAGWTYTNEKGEIWKIIGNDDDPHSNGRFCPRGTGGVGMYHDEDRLKQPMIRKTVNGKQEFKEVSWNQAFDYIANKMKKVSEEHGPESFALFNHGSSGAYFSTLLKAFGSSNIAAPSNAQCKAPREVGWEATFGAGLHSPEPTDIRDTKCLVLIGSHIGENMHNGQIQEMSDAIDKDATIITVDPRFSTAASHSKYWLPIKPATDLALLLSWIHVLIYEEKYDKKYINQYANGFDELKAHVKTFTPEWAYGITTIKPSVIRETAYDMAHASPAVIVHPGRHTTWYGDDTQRSRAIAILNALLGSFGKRGGFYLQVQSKLPSFPTPAYPKPKWTWKDVTLNKYPMAHYGVSNALIDASHPDHDSDKKIKAWFVAGTNLISTVPDTKRTIEAIQNLDLVVVIDTMPMEITGYADVILPECTYLERYDNARVSPGRIPNIAHRSPAAKPKYLSKPAWWMAKKIADRLGLDYYFNYNDLTEVLDWQYKQVGSSLQEMEKLGVKKFDLESNLYIADGEDYEFPTNSGKIELYSDEFASYGFDPIPVYTKHPEPEEGYYRLNYGRAPMHTFARTSNNPNLTDLMNENKIWINPRVAKIWGLKNEQEIWLKNQDDVISTFPIKVRITERIRFDSVYMIHGFGHNNKKLSRAHGKGANDTEMITNVMIDPINGSTGMRGNFVTFLLNNPKEEGKS